MRSGFQEEITRGELRSALSISGVYAVRMLGLFMILPVFSLYASELSYTTPFLVGMAIGVYGFTQAALQIPLGMLSDRVGRKPVIVGGLLILALGSALAALADSIYGVIMGRALQGAGAIASALMALAADLTREEHRTKVMAMIGLSIGASFAIALVAGPALNTWIGVRGIFWITGALALVAIAVTVFLVPQALSSRRHRDAETMPETLGSVLRDPQLLRLDLGIFVLHLVLTANFVVLPLQLRDGAGLDAAHHWYVYLPVLLLSFVAVIPLIILAEKRRRLKQVFLAAIAVLAFAQFSYIWTSNSLMSLIGSLWLFFAAFNVLEASLPSLVSKLAPADRKGTALGIYSSSQFLGIFAGGALGGALYGAAGALGVFILGALVALVWFLFAATMRAPRHLTSYLLNIGNIDAQQAQAVAVQLTRVRGVAEAVVIGEEGIAYLKVDPRALDIERLREFSATPA